MPGTTENTLEALRSAWELYSRIGAHTADAEERSLCQTLAQLGALLVARREQESRACREPARRVRSPDFCFSNGRPPSAGPRPKHERQSRHLPPA